MVEKITVKTFNSIEDGATDWKNIRSNFVSIGEVMNEHARELKALAQHQTFSISGMFENTGKHVLAKGGKHLRCKAVNAFAVVHDTKDEEFSLTLTGLSMPLKFNGEKKGSGRIFDLVPNAIHFVDDIAVELTANRRVSVYVTLESIEERD